MAPPAIPVQAGPLDIRFDFNEGCRVLLPPGQWRVQLRDLDTANVLYDDEVGGCMVTSAKKYYVRFGIEVWQDGVSVFRHDYDAAGREVMARMEVGGLGDQIAWLGQAVAFAEKHSCRLTCCMQGYVIALFRDAYPQVRFVQPGEADERDYYASYKLNIFYNDHHHSWQPCDYRVVGLCHTAAYILGLAPREQRPNIAIDAGGPPIEGRYVCIATQATNQKKYWNNPNGWDEIVGFLKAQGYRVICIDQKTVNGKGNTWNYMPAGAEDQTGDRPLTERARWLYHAAFFIGLSSGLSWIAWAVQRPVVLISGFSHPLNEFSTPYRVINFHVCNSCANDVRIHLDPNDFCACPHHGGTARMFECSRLITADHVKRVIGEIPGFGVAAGGVNAG